MARIGNCQCPYCYCPFPGKPGIQVDNKYICWRCKPHLAQGMGAGGTHGNGNLLKG